MKVKHYLFAVLAAAILGSNFVAIKFTLNHVPPFLLLTTRFILCSLPFLWFIPRPNVSWKFLLQVGFFLWIAHFSLVFTAIYMGLPAGLTSLIAQSQLIFTVVFSSLVFGHRLKFLQLFGIMVAIIGVIGIACQLDNHDGTLVAFLMLIAAAIAMSISNILFRQIGPDLEIVAIVVWSSLVAIIPMFLLSLYFEGFPMIMECCLQVTLSDSLAIIYTSWASTLIAYSLWSYLMNRYEPSHVVPFCLLIPIFGMFSTFIVLGERFSAATLIAGSFVIIGLGINQISQIRQIRDD